MRVLPWRTSEGKPLVIPRSLAGSLAYPRSLLLCLALTVGFWIMFYPTVFSRDAFYMLLDATIGTFNDMHPLLIPQVLALLLQFRVAVSWLTLAQLLAGFLGIRRLAMEVARLWGVSDPAALDWLALVVLVLVAVPLTPLAIYLATIWSDTWLMICLIWAITLLLELRRRPADGSLPWLPLAAIIVLIAGSVLARYNAAVVYPFLAFLFFDALRGLPLTWPRKLALVSLPLLLAGVFLLDVYLVYPIDRSHPERAVYALDLASMIRYDPSICQDLSIHNCDDVLNFSPQFQVGHGAIDLTFTQLNEYLYQPFLDLFFDRDIDSDFRYAAIQHPGLLLTVKVLNFLDYIGPRPAEYYFQKSLVSKDILQMPWQKFASPIGPWFNLSLRIIASPVLRWYSFVHSVWLVVNALAFALALFFAIRFRDARAAAMWKVLLIPASYYASFLVAFTTAEFRFMYPSLLIVQLLAFATLASLLARRNPQS